MGKSLTLSRESDNQLTTLAEDGWNHMMELEINLHVTIIERQNIYSNLNLNDL